VFVIHILRFDCGYFDDAIDVIDDYDNYDDGLNDDD
jgi:hypothetical protein